MGITDEFALGHSLVKPEDRAYICIHSRHLKDMSNPSITFFEGCSLDYLAGYMDGRALFVGHHALVRNGLNDDEHKFVNGQYHPLTVDPIRYLVDQCDLMSASSSVNLQGFDLSEIALMEPTGDYLAEKLSAELVPHIRESQISRLTDIIAEAQENCPEDRALFTQNINRILDAQNLRIRLPTGDLARLTYKRKSVQFRIPGRGTLGFFKHKGIEVERVPENYPNKGSGVE